MSGSPPRRRPRREPLSSGPCSACGCQLLPGNVVVAFTGPVGGRVIRLFCRPCWDANKNDATKTDAGA